MIPESRLQGYNPLTGAISVSYRFTYAGVSGGQDIKTKVEFICDSEAPGGDHCPTGRYTSDDRRMGSSFKVPSLYIRKGGSAQDTVVVTDTKAKFRYNQIQLTHTYMLKGEQKTKVMEPENIFQKGEFLLANCYFSAGALGAGAGFSCETLFDNDALMSAYVIETKYTNLAPYRSKIYYPGNSLFLHLAYSVTGDQANYQNSFDLAYIATCKASGDNAKAIKKDVVPVPVPQGGTAIGTAIIDLFKFPTSLNSQTQNKYSTVNLHLAEDDLTEIWDASTSKLKSGYESGNAELIFYNKNSLQATSFIVMSAQGLDSSKYSNFIGQSLNVNKDQNSITTTNVKYNIPYIDIVKNGAIDIQLDFKDETTDVVVVLRYGSGTQKIFTNGINDGTDEYQFDKLQAGPCTLEVRILPSGKGYDAINSENFEKYSSLGDEIQTDSKQATQDYAKLSFTMAQAPSVQVFGIEILEPYDSASYCVDTTKTTLPLGYVHQTSNNKKLSTAELSYTISLDRQTVSVSGSKTLELGKNKEDIDISKIVNAIKGEGTQDIKVVYELTTKLNDITTGVKSKTESGKIEFSIKVPGEGETCDDFSLYDYKAEEEGEKVDDGAKSENNNGED